jgi:hypothetical protein
MTFRRLSGFFRLSAFVLVVSGAFCPTLHAQALLASATVPEAPAPAIEPMSPVVITRPAVSAEHKFWDKQNRVLFIAAAVSNGADFAVTRANLQSGGQELNPVVRMFGRSTPSLAMNFIGETAGVMSLSYFFHKTGHHKLERVVSMVNIGSSAGAVGFGLAHR